MSEGLSEAAHSFSNEIQPKADPAPAPRDSRGRFVESVNAPEPIFGFRQVEGDETGDTRDGGDFEALRAHERRIANGEVRERNDGEDSSRSRRASGEDGGSSGERRLSKQAAERSDAAADDGHSGTEIEPEDIWSITAEDAPDAQGADKRPTGDRSDAEGSPERDAEAGEKFEVTVDGETLHITLQEALRGYVREATFHKRMQGLAQAQQELAANDAYVRGLYAQWQADRKAYEEDVANMLPAEPNWDQEFAANPQNAHWQQKVFQTIYGKLAASQQARAQRAAEEAADRDRRVQKYAVDGFSRFVLDNKIPDEKTLNKNLQSMRRTAQALGFSEYEVATVYDPRMLTCLLKASKYDRIVAARPQAVIPGKGRTLPPGAATPFGNAPRKGLDEALRRQAANGSLDATVDVFRRLL